MNIETFQIEPVAGERMTFFVRSQTAPKYQYRVDLLANDGAGFCQCPDHSIRRQPAIDRGEPKHTRETVCKHSAAAREFFLRQLLETMAKAETQ